MTLETLIPLKTRTGIAAVAFAAVMMPLPAAADPFFFSTGNPDGKIATATRPESAGKFEIESADDFSLTAQTSITGATFTGLLTEGSTTANIGQVVVEIYQVFPNGSDVGRTSGAPVFSTNRVPTRANSPSDVALDSRDFPWDRLASKLRFWLIPSRHSTASNLAVYIRCLVKLPAATVSDRVGSTIHSEFFNPVRFGCGSILLRPASHLISPWGLSLALGTEGFVPSRHAFPRRFYDLQSWTRARCWTPTGCGWGPTSLAVHSGKPTFNAAFSLTGVSVPLPSSALAFPA